MISRPIFICAIGLIHSELRLLFLSFDGRRNTTF
jgi:hypothetical protein